MPDTRLLSLLLTPAALAASGIAWDDLPPLPRAISGQFAGVSGGALLVAGGSYFDAPMADGGKKVWVNSMFVLEPGAREWKTISLPDAVAYGASVTTPQGLLLIGGGNREANRAAVLRLRWHDGQLAHDTLPPLPRPLANCVAAIIGTTVYVASGQETPTATAASRSLFALDLKSEPPHWVELEQCPGAGRILPALVALDGSLYLFGGAELTDGGRRYLRDGWRYRPGAGWSALPEMPESRVAAPAVARSPHQILLIGGDDGSNAAHAQELGDRHPGFRRDIAVFDTHTGGWTHEDGLPAGLVTTTPVLWNGDVVIPGGEDRPGHRSARVLRGHGTKM